MNATNETDAIDAESGPAPIVYRPRGGAKTMFESRASEVLICGPSGTGKTRACLEKVNALCELHAGIRVLLVRATRKSLSESALVTYEKEVLLPDSPVLQGPDRQHRSRYTYPNGSEIVLGGLDEVSRIMSSQFDLVYVPEAVEITEGQWEVLLSRLRNNCLRDRKTGEPWHQAIADCNPAHPAHWLKRRTEVGRMEYVETRHEDNPACTPDYLERLSQLTGVRRQRLYLGQWVAAEGNVYAEWDRTIHLVDRFPIPPEWLCFRAVDFGFRDPFVCLWLAVDPDGRLYVYRQLYMTGRLVEDHGRDILRLSAAELVATTICDHDAEGRATLERAGIPTIGAIKNLLGGIQAVQARLRCGNEGKPRLSVLRDSLVERDPVLMAAKRPLCLEDEFECYQWSSPREGGVLQEAPLDRDNHALDALRYGIVGLRITPPGGTPVPEISLLPAAPLTAETWRR